MNKTPAYSAVSLPVSGSEEILEGVIVPSDGAAEYWLGLTGERSSQDFWTPAPEDVEFFEKALATYEPRTGHLEAPPEKGLSSYRRQYLGRLVDGQRRLFVLLLDPASLNLDSLPWRSEAILIDDGGDAVFEAEFDVDNKVLLSLHAHGES